LYRRHDWDLVHTFDDALWVPTGISQEFIVATHRYRKRVSGQAEDSFPPPEGDGGGA